MRELAVVVFGFASFIFVGGKNIVVNHANQIKNEAVVYLNKSLPQGKIELFRMTKFKVSLQVEQVEQEVETKEKSKE